jgi:carbamoyltransferase
MKVLGYSGGLGGYVGRFGTSHDAAAALVIDGEVVAAAEEERFDRVKRSGAFPMRAIEHCLREVGIASCDQLDLVCYYHSHARMFDRAIVDENAPGMPRWARPLFAAGIHGLRLARRIAGHGEHLSERTFAERTGWAPPKDRWRVVGHHLAHAASAFYESPFDRALCLVLDAQGESASGTAFLGDDRGLHVLAETFAPNSVGYLYQSITRFLGFANGDEYKVMGLAPYGDPSRHRAFFERALRTGPDGRFVLDPALVGWLVLRDAFRGDGLGYPRAMIEALGEPRREHEPIDRRHMDVAAALQEALERGVLSWLERLRHDTGLRELCLAGGVALNCTMNGKIARSGIFDRVHVAPASHDAGTAAGAALHGHAAILHGARRVPRRPRVFLGPAHGSIAARHAIREVRHRVRATRPDDLAMEIARSIATGKIVAVCHGRMEWGPRALGNRSILADPRRAETKDVVNHAVKLREGFRPFAPAVLHEEADRWFDLRGLDLWGDGGESPFMLFAVPVLEHQRARIPSVTHVDGSARVQTVRREDNPRFHAILRAFFELTGVPVLLNTSFNVKGEPIVATPSDAIRCYLSTRIDLLVLDDLLLGKRRAAERTRSDRPPRTRPHAAA